MPDVDAYRDADGPTGERDQFISVGKAAAILRISVSTLQRWDRADYFRAHRTPFTNQRRYRLRDVEALRDEMYPAVEGELSA
jgi:hypothetical protein